MADRSDDTATLSEVEPHKDAGKVGYKMFASLGATLGATLTRRALTASWTRATGKEPPTNPENPDVRWVEAISWAVISAAAVAAARVVAQRRVAATWHRASGAPPPGLTAADE
jgi:Protein of unknown function (DUF4235)